VWKMVLSYLQRERNDKGFEDDEKSAVDLMPFFFKTFFHWIAALDLNVPSFHDFLNLLSLSS
jgi:uncharacterized membrane protein YkvA (DUF1232 family)